MVFSERKGSYTVPTYSSTCISYEAYVYLRPEDKGREPLVGTHALSVPSQSGHLEEEEERKRRRYLTEIFSPSSAAAAAASGRRFQRALFFLSGHCGFAFFVFFPPYSSLLSLS